MSMTNNSSTSYSSMKRIVFVLGLLALLVSTEFAAVHGRALRSTTTDNVVVNPGREEQGGPDNEAIGVSSFANNSSNRKSFRSLAYKLASGPNTKGPGH
ncbi:uncharacterized protein LOC111301232 [Durio zibethinus]|uniref:Uncharacterized protein LOC111301232 n=1 Tax=Durio zibethinus TaxID=66656 RepID=A0A6P5ZI02_DURZI|nr:uncharacterized protein LOC111301232 [Durio zibethinus]